MAKHQGVRKTTRKRLNRSVKCAGDQSGYDSFYLDGTSALSHAIRHLRDKVEKGDKRTREMKNLVAVIARLEALEREISR